MKNPKNKGSKFERYVAKKLSLWWSDNERDDIFYLTSGSGARATTRKKKGIDTANSSGDIGTLDLIGKPFIDTFLIEVKRGYTLGTRINETEIFDILKEFDVLLNTQNMTNPFVTALGKIKKIYNRGKTGIIDPLDFIDSKKKEPLLLEWWRKAENERKGLGRKWSLIIFQRDGKKPCVVCDSRLFLGKYFKEGHLKIEIQNDYECKVTKKRLTEILDLSIVEFDTFLKIFEYIKNYA